MILSDSAILRELESGNIIISPFDRKYLNPNSVDLTLNPTCKIYKPEIHLHTTGHRSTIMSPPPVFEPARLDCRKPTETEEFVIPEEGFELQPNTLYLYSVNERIGVKRGICARVEGKSSLARLGLFIHVTAGWIDTGFEGSLVLELHCIQPLRIYPNQKIAQICYMRVEGEVDESYDQKAGSKYMNQTGVQASLMHQNFKDEENGKQCEQGSTTAE